MRIALGADHAGFALKEALKETLEGDGHAVIDRGTSSEESCDYPEFAAAVAEDVAGGRADRGILVCSTGIGMAIAANKAPGIRAAPAMNADAVALTRSHNDANVLTLGSRYLVREDAAELVRIFLETPFSGGRHQRRINGIRELERAALRAMEAEQAIEK
jgi:ribose 5-phosphate isomerase B